MPIELIFYYCLDKLILSLQFVVKSTLTTLNDSLPWLLITQNPTMSPSLPWQKQAAPMKEKGSFLKDFVSNLLHQSLTFHMSA